MEFSELAKIVEAEVSDVGGTIVEIEQIKKGGSDRSFYRLRWRIGDSLIAVQYSRGQTENHLYIEIAEFLHNIGINVPKLIFHNEEKGVFCMQDLGAADLWDWHNKPWTERRPLYESALREVYTLHRDGIAAVDQLKMELHPGFDEGLYFWEQQYFFENCVERHFGVSGGTLQTARQCYSLVEVAQYLAKQPRVLVHRDYQSQNIMVKDGGAWMIDFQGMREGVAQYDLASLLYDPYLDMSDAERAELLGYYVGLMEADGTAIGEEFYRTMELCKLQRLMQALGAYGYLGHVKRLDKFLEYIVPALVSLRKCVAGLGEEFRPLHDLLAELG